MSLQCEHSGSVLSCYDCSMSLWIIFSLSFISVFYSMLYSVWWPRQYISSRKYTHFQKRNKDCSCWITFSSSFKTTFFDPAHQSVSRMTHNSFVITTILPVKLSRNFSFLRHETDLEPSKKYSRSSQGHFTIHHWVNIPLDLTLQKQLYLIVQQNINFRNKYFPDPRTEQTSTRASQCFSFVTKCLKLIFVILSEARGWKIINNK